MSNPLSDLVDTLTGFGVRAPMELQLDAESFRALVWKFQEELFGWPFQPPSSFDAFVVCGRSGGVLTVVNRDTEYAKNRAVGLR